MFHSLSKQRLETLSCYFASEIELQYSLYFLIELLYSLYFLEADACKARDQLEISTFEEKQHLSKAVPVTHMPDSCLN